MSKNQKHDPLDDPENALRCISVQLNHQLPANIHTSLVDGIKLGGDKMILVTKKDLLTFAETQKLYVNTENMTEKQKNDKSLVGLPRAPTRTVMTEAFKRFTAVTIEQKMKERLAAQKLANDQKMKEKQKAAKQGLGLASGRNSIVEPELTVAPTYFDFVFILDGYPFEVAEYVALQDTTAGLGYLINVNAEVYIATDNLIESSNGSHIAYDQNLVQSGQLILKEKFETQAERKKKFEYGVMLSDLNSSLKQASQIHTTLHLVENSSTSPAVESFLLNVWKTLEENEHKKSEFIKDLKKAVLRPINLHKTLQPEDTEKLISDYQQNYSALSSTIFKKEQLNPKNQINLILESMSAALNTKYGFPNNELSPIPTTFSPNSEYDNRPKINDELNYEFSNQTGVDFDTWKKQPANDQSPFNRSELARLIPFFATNETEIADKISLLALENGIRACHKDISNFDAFDYNYFEVLNRSLLVPQYLESQRKYAFERKQESCLDGSNYRCLYNIISPVFDCEKEWSLPNRFVPNFAFANRHPEAGDLFNGLLYNWDVCGCGKLQKRRQQIFNTGSCFISLDELTLRNNQTADISIFNQDLTLLLRKSNRVPAYYNYIETESIFPASTFPPELTPEQIEAAQKKNKNKKDEEIKTPTIYPKTSVEAFYFKKPETAEFQLTKAGSLIKAMCEIEAYFDVAKLFNADQEFCYKRLLESPAIQDKVSFGLSLTLKCFDGFVKILPSGDLFMQNETSNEKNLYGRILTKTGHIIKYYKQSSANKVQSLDANPAKFINSIDILHPKGNISSFKDGRWTVISEFGKRTLYTSSR